MRKLLIFGFAVFAPSVCLGISWTAAGNVAPWTQYQLTHGAAIVNGYVYCVGGTIRAANPPQGTGAASSDTFSVYRARINAPGSLSAWTTCTATLPAGATYPADPEYCYISRHVNTYGGRIYITGGNTNRSGIAERNTVTYAQPDASGNITAWTAQPAGGSSIARWEHASIIDQTTGRLYVIGGGSSAVRSTRIDVAQIRADGSVGDFSLAGNLSVAVAQMGAAIRNGKLYVFGGNRGTAISAYVQHATINSDGTLSTFSTASTPLPEERFDCVAATCGSRIFVMGGCVTGDVDTRDTVWSAQFDSQGVITGWNVESPLPALSGLRRMPAVTDTTGMYVLGGRRSATEPTSAIHFSSIPSRIDDWSIY